MSPVTIALLSALVVLFLLLLVLIGGSLILISIKAYKYVNSFKSELDGLIKELREESKGAQKELVEAVRKINGDDLQRAVQHLNENVKHMGKFTNRAEEAALAIGAMCRALMPPDEVKQNNLGPEEYAPPDAETGSFVGQSKVARLDEEAARDM